MKARICRDALQKSGRSDEVATITRNKEPIGTDVTCVEGIQITSSDVNCLNGVRVSSGSESMGQSSELEFIGTFKRGEDGIVRPVPSTTVFSDPLNGVGVSVSTLPSYSRKAIARVKDSVSDHVPAAGTAIPAAEDEDLTCITNPKILHVAAQDAFKFTDWNDVRGPSRCEGGKDMPQVSKGSLTDWELSDIKAVCGAGGEQVFRSSDRAGEAGELGELADRGCSRVTTSAREVCSAKLHLKQEGNEDSRKEPRTVKDTSGKDRGLKGVLRRFLNL